MTRVTADPPDLNLGLLLFIPYRFMESAVLETLRSAGHQLSLSQARVFQRIDPEGSRLADLAVAAQLSKQTLSSIVDQLEKAGYVRREPDPQDARARLVRITTRGQELIDTSTPVVREIEAAWEAHLGRARTRQLTATLAELCALADQHTGST